MPIPLWRWILAVASLTQSSVSTYPSLRQFYTPTSIFQPSSPHIHLFITTVPLRIGAFSLAQSISMHFQFASVWVHTPTPAGCRRAELALNPNNIHFITNHHLTPHGPGSISYRNTHLLNRDLCHITPPTFWINPHMQTSTSSNIQPYKWACSTAPKFLPSTTILTVIKWASDHLLGLKKRSGHPQNWSLPLGDHPPGTKESEASHPLNHITRARQVGDCLQAQGEWLFVCRFVCRCLESKYRDMLGRSFMNLIPLACRWSITHTLDTVAVISPEITFLGAPVLGL